MQQRFMDVYDVAKWLKIRPGTLRVRVSRGQFLAPVKIDGSRKKYWLREDIENYMVEQIRRAKAGRKRK